MCLLPQYPVQSTRVIQQRDAGSGPTHWRGHRHLLESRQFASLGTLLCPNAVTVGAIFCGLSEPQSSVRSAWRVDLEQRPYHTALARPSTRRYQLPSARWP